MISFRLKSCYVLGFFTVSAIVNAQSTASSQALLESTDDDKLVEEVVITGYRGALLNSTNAKRNSVGFKDEVFADDIGKMPSQNLAESLSRIPGVKVSREVTGEGQQITVRGLGSAFTKVVMNGNSIAVASDGSLGSGSRGRHVDLDIFPTELFSSLAVNKTTTAQQIEGGVSGYVNMRTLRASDMGEGNNVRVGLEGAYNDASEQTSPKASLIFGHSSDSFGILAGVVSKQHRSRVDGYETIGAYRDGCEAEWADGVDQQTGMAIRTRGCIEASDGGTFHYRNTASADYVAVNGGAVGDALNLEQVSGLTAEQLDSFGLPYIARNMYTIGERNSVSGIVALEYTPSDNFAFTLDALHSKSDRTSVRNELSFIFRRNYIQYGLDWIPENIELNSQGALQRGTFYNNSPWVGSRDYNEALTYTSIMPAIAWQINRVLHLDLSASMTDSRFDRDDPYVLYYAPTGTLNVDFSPELPLVEHTSDVASGDGAWSWAAGPGTEGNEVQAGAFRFQRGSRDTDTGSLHVDFTLGEESDVNGIKFGFAWDKITADTGNYNGSLFLDNLAVDVADYIIDSPVQDYGISTGYEGVNGIASLDWNALKRDTNYTAFTPAQVSGGDSFGKTLGAIEETVTAAYAELNTESEIIGNLLRSNFGVRIVKTEQIVSTLETSITTQYSRILPSLSTVYDLHEAVKLRAGASRSLTRANPSAMFPESAWTSSGVDSASVGNPYLQPFESTNFDIGGEWYFHELGYIGFTYYEKDIIGFTRRETLQLQYQQLANYGLDLDNLGATQEIALAACGGRTSTDCIAAVSTNVNIDGNVNLSGIEVIWVMPLDWIFEGLGFDTSINKISQSSSDDDAQISGISDTFNFTGYYENAGFQTRITYSNRAATEASGGWAPIRAAERSQIDLAASYNLPMLQDYNMTLTFDAYNITNEPILRAFVSDGNTFNAYYPGSTYTVGIRGSF